MKNQRVEGYESDILCQFTRNDKLGFGSLECIVLLLFSKLLNRLSCLTVW